MDNYKNDGFPLASYGKYHNFSMLIEISWLINISQMNDARDTFFTTALWLEQHHFHVGLPLIPLLCTSHNRPC